MARQTRPVLRAAFVLVAVMLVATGGLGGLAHAASTTVTIQDFLFTPQNVTVNVGDTVTWSYPVGGSVHTTRSTTGVWDSGIATPIAPGGSFAHTFTAAGTFPYFCQFHPFMTGQVNVVLSGPNVLVHSVKDATNRRLVTISAGPGRTLSQLSWTVPLNAAVTALNGTPLPTGIVLPSGATTTSFHLHRLSGSHVTLRMTVTGSFSGTWNTFVGGGPSAW